MCLYALAQNNRARCRDGNAQASPNHKLAREYLERAADGEYNYPPLALPLPFPLPLPLFPLLLKYPRNPGPAKLFQSTTDSRLPPPLPPLPVSISNQMSNAADRAIVQSKAWAAGKNYYETLTLLEAWHREAGDEEGAEATRIKRDTECAKAFEDLYL
ncbi:hypothetical protein NUW58_g5556 [Xylaria curta]|uniref:Uncharacterized protein n=1 Tax=Xylaria curta TaxID=42375 RepID=A0ACC1P389_9PEZI|nr:hypothetical protein NUW58_g5556 [Xylaria curta]